MISKYLIGYDYDITMEKLNKLSKDDKILTIVKMNMDFNILERDEDGYVIYNGDMILDKKNISELPENFKVIGDLWVSFNPHLKELPKGLYVDGNLYCYKCSITKLPDNLYVGGSLDCSSNLLEVLPSGLNIKKDFTIISNLIEEIPQDIYVGGNLTCDDNYTLIINKGANIEGKIRGKWVQK